MKLNTLDFYIDVSNVCWGVIGEINEDYFIVPTEEWAPGIWAGSEAGWIQIVDPITKRVKMETYIEKIDLQNRKVWTGTNVGNVESGDLIYPKVYRGR